MRKLQRSVRQKELNLSFFQPDRERPVQAILEETCSKDKDKSWQGHWVALANHPAVKPK